MTKGTNPAAQYINGNTVYINGTLGGSFTVTANATDNGTGVGNVAFPDLNPAGGTTGSANPTLDPTFGNGGTSVTNPYNAPGSNVGFQQSGLQSNGKIIITGQVYDPNIAGPYGQGTYGFFAARYNADGSLDTTFGNNGSFFNTITGYSFSNSVNVGVDDSITLVGSNGTNGDPIVVRLTANGALDTTFGNGQGYVSFPGLTGNTYFYPQTSAVDSQGRVILVGQAQDATSGNSTLAIKRLLANGNVDTSFGPNGIFTYTNAAYPQGVYPQGRITIQGADKIIVGNIAYYNNYSSYDGLLIRVNSNGTVDTTFGSNGAVTLVKGYFNGVKAGFNGSLVARVYNNYNGNSGDALVRYSADGVLDTTFGTNGNVSLENAGQSVSDFIVRSNGNIAATTQGYNYTTNQYESRVMQLDVNGAVLNSSDAVTVGTYFSPQEIVEQNDGRLVIIGYAQDANGNAALGMAGLRTATPKYWAPIGGQTVTTAPYAVTYSWTPGAGGATNAQVVATDTTGNAATKAFNVVTDNAKPTVSITGPAGSNLNGTVTLTGIAADADAGLSGVVVTVDGNAVTCTGNFSCVINGAALAEGSHTIVATATDNVGNTKTATKVMFVDHTAPVLGLAVTASGTSVTVTPSATDNGSGFASGTVTYSGPANGTACTIDQGLAPCTWDASALPSGTYTLTFNGVDSAGNAATPVTKTVSIDAVAPTATVANLPATVTGIVTISGTAKDNIAVDNAKLCYTGPSSACVTLTVDAAGNWTTNVDTNPLPNGTYTFTLTVTDTAGNTKTATQTTNVANPVPAVGITAPLPNQEFTDATGLQGTFVLAQGTATSVSCQVRLGSVNGSLVKNITSCASPVDLSSLAVTGTPYYFVVTAANAAGSDTENVVFKVGKAPAVTITAGPADNAEVRDNAVQYSFTLDGATTAQCRLDNFPQTTACSGTFNTANAMYANQQIYGSLGAGNHTVTITASNAVGSASKTMHFTIPSQAVITSNPSTGPAFAQNDNFGNYGGSYAIYPRASHAYQAIKLLKENADGSMLVLGHDFVGGRDASGAYYNTYAVVIFKLKADLTMDTSYGTNGVLTVQNPATVNDPYPQLITSSGNHIYSVASGANYSMTAMTVRRWNFDGTEDTSFHSNVDMSAALAANHTYGSFTALKEDSDGHVIISATVITGSDYNNNDAILVRLNSDGSADTSFGDNGQSDIIQAVRSAGCSSSADYRRYSATDWAQETDGSYIVAGGGFSPCYRAMASYHMLANGHLDSTFGSGGATIATSTFGYSQGLRVDLVDNGTKFMVAGGNLASATVAKYNIDGTPDNTFNVNGDFNSHHYKELWDQGDHTCLAATQVTRDSQGRYYFFGTCPYGSNYNQHNFLSDYQYGIGRTTPSGDVDLSYGNSNNGISLVTPSDLPAATYAAGNDYPGSMSHYIGLDLLSNGRPLMTGERDVNGSAQALVRTQIAPDVEWVTAPNLTMTSGPAEGDTIGSYLHFEYKIAGNDPNPGITCSLVDGNGNTVPAGGCTSPIDVAGLADGTYTLTVSAAGSLGNGMGSIVRHFTVAAGTGSAPTAAFASGPADGGEVIATNATYGVSSSNATWTLCAVNNGPFKACDTSYKFTGLVAGANTVRIRAVNRNGVTNVTRSVTVFKASGMIYYSSYVNNSNAPYRSMDSLGQNNTSQGFSVWNGTNGYAISPNGRYLAVIRTVDGSGGLGGNTTQIYLYDLVNHTSSVVTSAYVTTGSGFPLRWNESSTKFSYITQPNPMTSATRYAYVYDVAAQTSTLVYGDDYYIFSVNFYPNSTDLLIDRGYYGYYRHTESMPTYNAGTYVMGNNSQGGDYEYISDLRFAPGDPNTVFYTSYDTNTNESILIRRNLTTNVKTEIVRSNTLNGWDISNDGTKVAYSMGYAGSANAGTFVASAVDGSGATLVAKALGQQNQPNYQPRFSPDGKMVAFGSQGGQDVSYVWQIAVVRVTGVDADNPAIAATTNSSDASNLAWR